MGPKDVDRMANSINPGQIAPLGAVWSGPTLFAQTCLSEILETLRYTYLDSHFTAVGSNLARVTFETSQVLLVHGQLVFLGDLPFSPHLTTDLAQNEWNNLNGL